MNSYNLPEFLPGSTNAEGRRRYALQELLCLRTACLKKPSGMQDYARDGQLMQCSLLDSSSDAFNWEQVAGSLQDAMSSSGSGIDNPTSTTRCSPTGRSSSPSCSSPGKRSQDRRSRLQRSSSVHAGVNGVGAVLAGPSSPSCNSATKPSSRALPLPANTTSAGSRVSDGAKDSSTSADTDPAPQPLRKMLAASVAANKQHRQQHPISYSTSLPSSPHASPSPSSQMWGCFTPSPTTNPARAAAPAAPAGFVPASPAKAEPLPADLQDNIPQLLAQLSCADPSSSAQAAQQLAVLAFSSAANPDPSVTERAVGPLANMLRGAASDEQQEAAAAALWGLARGGSVHQAIIIDSNAVPRLTRMLGSKSSTLVYTALNALSVLVGHPGTKNQQRQQVFADAGAVHMLCTCLKVQAEQGSIKTQQVAAEVLLALAVGNYENQAIIVKQRTIEALVEMLNPKDHPPGAPQAVAVHLLLQLVASHHAGNTAAVFAAGALTRLEKLLRPHDGFRKYSEEGAAVLTVIDKLLAWQQQQKQSAMRSTMVKEMAQLQQSQLDR